MALVVGGAVARAAEADQLAVSLTSPVPEQGVPLTLTFSGSAGAVNSDGDGPDLYAVVRPTGGIGCQSSYGADQAAAGSASSNLVGNFDNSENVSPGSFALQTTYNPPNVGSYMICAWLENGSNDESDSPYPPGQVTAGPVASSFSARGPQVGELSVTVPSGARPGVAFQIDYTTQTDQQLSLESVVKRAGGLPCASSYELETQQNQTESDLFNFDSPSVFGGPVTSTATDTEDSAGPYVICSWIEGPNSGEVDAAASTPIYVGTPPVYVPPACVVPRFGGLGLSAVERRLIGHHCTIGRIRYTYSRVHRGLVLGLSARAGRHLAHNARIGILVSAGRKPKHHHHHG